MDKVSDMYASHAVWLRRVLDTLREDEAASAPLKKMKTDHSPVDGNESEEVDDPVDQMLAAKGIEPARRGGRHGRTGVDRGRSGVRELRG